MAIKPINLIALPIEEEIVTTSKVTKAVFVWEDNVMEMTAEPYNGLATIRYNGALKHKFRNETEPSGVENRLRYDKNISLLVTENDSEWWVIRAMKERGLCGILSYLKPVCYDGYPCDLVLAYHQDGQIYQQTTLILDDVEVTLHNETHIFAVDAHNLQSLRLISLDNRGNRKEWAWDGDIHLISNATEITNETYITNGGGRVPHCPFYVRWINAFGGYDYWMFGGKKRFTKSLDSIDTYERDGDNGQNTLLDHMASEAVTASTGIITKEQAKALEYLLYSPEIVWYDEASSEWIKLTMPKGTKTSWDNDQPTGELQFTFNLPTPQIVI